MYKGPYNSDGRSFSEKRYNTVFLNLVQKSVTFVAILFDLTSKSGPCWLFTDRASTGFQELRTTGHLQGLSCHGHYKSSKQNIGVYCTYR